MRHEEALSSKCKLLRSTAVRGGSSERARGSAAATAIAMLRDGTRVGIRLRDINHTITSTKVQIADFHIFPSSADSSVGLFTEPSVRLLATIVCIPT
eukprot:5402313-Pleurochrysis_carterae.AAC.2